MLEIYYNDSMKMSKQSLINITLSNGTYHLKESISSTKAKVLIIVGEKEISVMQKSAKRLHKEISESELYIAIIIVRGHSPFLRMPRYIQPNALFRSEYLDAFAKFFISFSTVDEDNCGCLLDIEDYLATIAL